MSKTGRPTKYTKILANAICAELAQGKSIRTVCAADGMPAVATIFNWFRTQPDFLEQYARAKQESADAMADEILDIADDGNNDWMLRRYGKDEVYVENGEALQRSKLRVETRKWLMAKMQPKKYSEKFQIDSVITKKLEDMSDEELIAEAKARVDRVNQIIG